MVFANLFFIYIFLPAAMLCYALARAGDRALNAAYRQKMNFTAVGENPAVNIMLLGLTVLFYANGHILYAVLLVLVISMNVLGNPVNENPLSNAVLIIFSLIFYAWGEPFYVMLMLVSAGINYVSGIMIDRGGRKSKAALIIGVSLNVLIICVYKYSGFIAESLCAVGLNVKVPEISLPIGISFYTFQSISYLADVYQGRVSGQRSLSGLLLYISMFPQLIAGPIVRYSTISEEIDFRSISIKDISEGAFRFIIGLGKKVILANRLSVITGGFLDGDLNSLTVGGAWLGIIAFTLYIYFDFSGYSDMAIGLGRCLGFHFDENFNYPYVCNTITDFWRRWHISLGSFFRDYVYIPLGGNRKHQPLNILVVWFLTGLWHGASWNFVLWGLYFGIIIMIEKYTIVKVQNKIPSVVLHLYSMFIIIFGWVIFYFVDFGRLAQFIKTMFGFGSGGVWNILVQDSLAGNAYLLIAAVACALPLGQLIGKYYKASMKLKNAAPAICLTVGKTLCAFALLAVSTLLLIADTNNPFLYFRF